MPGSVRVLVPDWSANDTDEAGGALRLRRSKPTDARGVDLVVKNVLADPLDLEKDPIDLNSVTISDTWGSEGEDGNLASPVGQAERIVGVSAPGHSGIKVRHAAQEDHRTPVPLV